MNRIWVIEELGVNGWVPYKAYIDGQWGSTNAEAVSKEYMRFLAKGVTEYRAVPYVREGEK